MFLPDAPNTTGAPMKINLSPESQVAAIQIPNTPDSPFMTLKKKDGSLYGHVTITPGGFVFTGSDGQPHSMCCQINNVSPPAAWTLVQALEVDSFLDNVTPAVFSPIDEVSEGDLLLLAMWTETVLNPGQDIASSVTPSDDMGNDWRKASGTVRISGPFTWIVLGVDQGPFDFGASMSLWYTVAKADGPLVVTVASDGDGDSNNGVSIGFEEWEGNHPDIDQVLIDGLITTNPTQSVVVQPVGLQLTVNGLNSNDLLIASFGAIGSTSVGSNFSADINTGSILVESKANSSGDTCVDGANQGQLGPGNSDGSGDPLPTVYGYLGVGASFKAAPLP